MIGCVVRFWFDLLLVCYAWVSWVWRGCCWGYYFGFCLWVTCDCWFLCYLILFSLVIALGYNAWFELCGWLLVGLVGLLLTAIVVGVSG